MKIVFCINSIIPQGGPVVASVTVINALSHIEGNRLWVIVENNAKNTQIVLHPSVQVVDLGISNYSHAPFPSNIPSVIKTYFRQKKALDIVLNSICPDIVVSTGQFEKYILPFIKGKWKIVRVFHALLDEHIREAKSSLERIVARFGLWVQRRVLNKRYSRIAVLTEEEKKLHWLNDPRVYVIPNPLTFRPSIKASLEDKRIISAGRLVTSKNYVSLVRAFSLIASRFSDWSLDIYGQGEGESQLQKEIALLGLEGRVHLKGFSSNIQEEMVTSSVFAHSSLWESFGLVLIEAMSCGLPVVAYDCPVGPRSIIKNRVDGFLVPLGDERAFADYLSQLIENVEMRKRMGLNAIETSKKYSIGRVTASWMALFEEMLTEKD